jgi:hypothetical protein
VVRYLVEDAGIGQLIDIGSGLPTADNVHEIAQRINPVTRVVYVDNDPSRPSASRSPASTRPGRCAASMR